MNTIAGLVDKLKDKDEQARCKAIHALGESGDVAAVLPLLKAWNDKNKDVREEVSTALGKLGDLPNLSCRIIADSRFPVEQRAEVVALLRNETMRHDPHVMFLFSKILSHTDPGYVRRSCQTILKKGDLDAHRGAQEVLNYLDGKELLRASQANSETEKDELLRGTQRSNADSEADDLLRPLDAPCTKSARRPSLWERLFGRRDSTAE